MDKSSIEETLRRSREVDERYKRFLKDKEETDKQWEVTQAKIEKTLNRLSETKDTLKKIDQLYQNYQKSFEKAINSALQKIEASKLLEVPDPNFVPRKCGGKEIAELMLRKKKIAFMTGAGVSAASGIPTFRDKDGYWMKKREQNINPQQFLTMMNFEKQPLSIWEWLQEFYCTKMKCKPNRGHGFIDAMCNKLMDNKKEVCIITQNIDNFHVQSQARVSKYPIYEVHGNILSLRCDQCAAGNETMKCFPYKDYREEIKGKRQPKCKQCKGDLRPHIMFFDQFYQEKFHRSESVKEFMKDVNLLIVIGTALQTGLARMTVENCLLNKVEVLEINTQCTIKQNGVLWMEGKSEDLLASINDWL